MMVDALIVAAQSEDSEYFEDKDEVPQVPQQQQQQQRTQSQVRICEFCGSSNTPTWRRGPGGKGSLCNACGIKWRLRKRTKKGDHPVEKVKSTKAPATKRRRREKDMDETNHMTTLRHPITFKETSNVTSNNNNNNNHINTMNHHHSHSHPSLSIYINDEEDRNSDGKKSYYCKFCNKTFNHTHFKNSQQFGAHCSNCSRRPSLSHQDGIVPYESDPLSSPSSSSSSSSSYSPLKRPFHYLSSPSPSLSPSSSPSPSPSYYEAISNRNPSKRLFAPPPYEDPGYNLLLILRIMQDELADFEEEASRLAAINSTPSLPSLSSLSSHSHSHSHSHVHPIPASPFSHSHSLSSHSLSARPHVMITPTPVL